MLNQQEIAKAYSILRLVFEPEYQMALYKTLLEKVLKTIESSITPSENISDDLLITIYHVSDMAIKEYISSFTELSNNTKSFLNRIKIHYNVVNGKLVASPSNELKELSTGSASIALYNPTTEELENDWNHSKQYTASENN